MGYPTRAMPARRRGSAAFSLGRWFTTVGLLAIVLPALTGAWLMSRLFESRMLQQEGRLTMQFVQGIIDVEAASSYFQRTQVDDAQYMEQLLAHIARTPDVLRTNLYSRERLVIWSSDATLVGRSFAGAANAELDAALRGELEIHEEEAEEGGLEKAEHANLRPGDDYFIELYVPVWDPRRENVVGAVELYRAPRHLQEAIGSVTRLIWAGAIGAAALLYVALLPLVRRADATIRNQRDRIVETETLAAMGDLGSAVAHGIRNPLAVIRSSAEIVKERADPGSGRDAAVEIIDQADRLEHWVRELLTYVHLPAGSQVPLDLEGVVRASVDQFGADMRRRGITAEVVIADSAVQVQGDSILLGQVFNSLIANAVEAMPHGGRLAMRVARNSVGFVRVELRDTGVGMSEEQLARALKPFHTTKSQGLGVGLPLARRIVERMGGRIALSSTLGEGTSVEVTLPVAGR